jgi:hypothetical protein
VGAVETGRADEDPAADVASLLQARFHAWQRIQHVLSSLPEQALCLLSAESDAVSEVEHLATLAMEALAQDALFKRLSTVRDGCVELRRRLKGVRDPLRRKRVDALESALRDCFETEAVDEDGVGALEREYSDLVGGGACALLH